MTHVARGLDTPRGTNDAAVGVWELEFRATRGFRRVV